MLNPIIKQKLSKEEYHRYARQIIIKEVSIRGQQRLKQSRILCIGAGGLNSPSLMYLTACGIGWIGIIDEDTIEVSNLQRQILYKDQDIQKNKVKAAFNTLKSLNPNIIINIHNYYLTKDNIQNILFNYDIIIDGTDSFKTRYIISQYCYALHKIHIYGAIDQFTGQISVFNYQNGPHYYTLYNNKSPQNLKNCTELGLINTIAGLIGILQATEAIKITLGLGSIISEYLLIFNILQADLNKIKIKKNKANEAITIQSQKNHPRKYLNIHQCKNDNKVLFIDVRTPLEFQIEHIKLSINIPLDILKKNISLRNLQTMEKYKIIIYCDNENRSYIASQILDKYKIHHSILKGGINAYKEREGFEPSLRYT